VVPGDVVEMHVGDRVPADTRIVALRTATLRAEQASLTGESVAVLKSVEAVEEEACELQAKVNVHGLLHSLLSNSRAKHVSKMHLH
jgi:Ca2+-transporting ATPase